MREIFYNTNNEIGSDHWLQLLNEAELSEWNWINSNMELVEKYVSKFELKDKWYLGRVLYVFHLLVQNKKDIVKINILKPMQNLRIN